MDFTGFDFDFSVDLDCREISYDQRLITKQSLSSGQHDGITSGVRGLPDLNSTLGPISLSTDHWKSFRGGSVAQLPAKYFAMNPNSNFHMTGDPIGSVSVDTCPHKVHTMLNDMDISQEGISLPSKQERDPREILKAWLAQNPETLYPSNADKKCLSGLVGLTVKQISTWFANYRERHLKPARTLPMQGYSAKPYKRTSWHTGSESDSSFRTKSQHAIAPSSPRRPLSPSKIEYNNSEEDLNIYALVLTSGLEEGFDFVTAWRATLPQDNWYDSIEDVQIDGSTTPFVRSETYVEVSRQLLRIEKWKMGPQWTATEAIRAHHRWSSIAASTPCARPKRSRSEIDPRSAHRNRRESSITSRNSCPSRPNDTVGSPAASGGTMSSAASSRSSVSRRGRRITQTCGSVPKPHHCVHCGQGFKRKADLRRHMESICDPSWGWVCAPIDYYPPVMSSDAPTNPSKDNSVPLCFCGEDPGDCVHQALRCWDRPKAERTFYRIDHIKQHLRGTHGLDLDLLTFDFSSLREPL